MFTDYISLLLINIVGALVVLCGFLICGVHKDDARAWAPAFAAPGLVALLVGLHMTLTWPIPDLSKVAEKLPNLQFANVAFGEMSVLLGVVFLAAALALAKQWPLAPISIFALVVGAMAMVVGVRLMQLGLTKTPLRTGVGFLLTGGAGVATFLLLALPGLRKRLPARLLAAAVPLAAALIWTCIAYQAFWDHLLKFSTPAK